MRIAPPLAVVLVVATATAQRPAGWVFQPAPNLATSATAALGKIAWAVTGNEVLAFSANTRRWASLPYSGTYTARQTNDWLMVDLGTTIAAFSAARGSFETISVSAGKTIVNPSANRNDVLLAVRDGNTLWTFSGMAGTWSSRNVSPNAAIAVERNAMIVVDGPNLAGYSATLDAWTTAVAAQAPSLSGISHTLGWAIAGNVIWGFSAIMGTWSSVTLTQPPLGSPVSNGDVALWKSSAELVGFSGITGSFDVLATPATSLNLQTSDHVGYASPDGVLHYGFGSTAPQWTVFTSTAPAAATVSGSIVILTEPTQVIAYSGIIGTAVATPLAGATSAIAVSVAASLDAGNSTLRLYSSLLGAWFNAPVGAQIALPELARSGALLTDGGTQWWGFSSRFGNFVPHNSGANPTRWVGAESSILAVESDTALAAFDARRNHWATVPVVATHRPLDIRIWRTSFVAHIPQTGQLLGFGALNGEFESAPINGALVNIRANSEVGLVHTTTGLHGYAAFPDLGTEVQFPEFRRLTAVGAPFTIRMIGEANAAHGIVIGVPDALDTPVPGLGVLRLVPASIVAFPPATLDANGRYALPLTIPASPALRGLEFGLQAVVVPGAGTPYLTQLSTLRIP